ELLDQPGLVEERRAHLAAAAVGDLRGDQGTPPAQRPGTCADYSTFDRDFALGEAELRDRDLLRRGLMPARRVLQQVTDGRDAEGAQALRERRPDAGQRRDVERVEPLRRRPTAR